MITTNPMLLFLRDSFNFSLKKVCLFPALLLFLSITALAQPVNIVISPQATARNVGQSFTVLVAADFTGATPPLGVDDIEVHLSFDNTKLQVTSIIEEPTVSAFTAKPIPLESAPFTATNTAGQINYAASTTTGIPTTDFNVLSITFLVIGGDGTTSPLTLQTDPPDDTRAAINGGSVLADIINGSITINAATCITPTVTISAQAGACDAQTFNLVLASAPVGIAPFDLTITGPGGTATYNDVEVGGVINFTPPVEKIWPAAPVPVPLTNLDASVTLGVKFTSSVSGFVKGVRFFSPDQVSPAPGEFTGQLWAATGTLLASGTFTNVTTSSWQELIFASPILIAANTTYIASYHTTGIRYASTTGGLNAAVTNGSLTALDNASAGGNGVYSYGPSPSFPIASFNASNYWADVIFSPNNYTFNLTGVKDANECSNVGPLQTLAVTSVDCSSLPVNIVVNPQTTTATVGQSITVLVATDFTGAAPPPGVDEIELHLAFDNTKLQVTSITEESTVSAFTSKPIPLEGGAFTITNATGQINYEASTTTGIPTSDFNILSITFLVIGGDQTTTPLTLRKDPPDDDTRAASSGSSVLSSVINGLVNINPAGCSIPTATLSAPGAIVTTCDGQSFNLVLAASPAPVGTAPFDLTITGPTGTVTYNDIPVGGTITSFTPTTEKLWPAALSTLPPTESDAAVTLGVKFRSAASGYVRGVRFFSASLVSLTPGDYTGQLWSAAGDLLASGTFTGVTASSWQELIFSSPILIDANTIYVASYHTNTINYVGTAGGFTSEFNNGSLTAPDNVSSGGNGIYAYGGAALFPSNAVGANYWVDVIFSPNSHTFSLTGIKDANNCSNIGPLQILNLTSVDCSTLPVTLLNFSATPDDNKILLHWTTTTEINNKGFEIQRSTNGSNWSAIGFVNGTGNSTSEIEYSYVDGNLLQGKYYYRLKQIDIDQRFIFSAIVSATLAGKGSFSLEQNYPNPFRNETIVRFTLPQRTKVKLSLFDMHGRLVKVLVNESKEQGSHAVNFFSGNLTAGLYYYKIQAGDFSAVKKMTIQ